MANTTLPVIKEICNKFIRDDMSSEEIAEWLILSGKYQGKGKPESVARLVRSILYRYRLLLKIDKEFEEVKQIHRIKRKIKKAPETKKDVYDWECLLDNKITPKKIEHSGKIDGAEQRIIIIRDGNKIETKKEEQSVLNLKRADITDGSQIKDLAR